MRGRALSVGVRLVSGWVVRVALLCLVFFCVGSFPRGGRVGVYVGRAWGMSGSRVLGWGAANVGCGQMPDHFEMTADVPGFTKDHINVEVHEVRCGGHSGRCGCGGRLGGYSASCVCCMGSGCLL